MILTALQPLPSLTIYVYFVFCTWSHTPFCLSLVFLCLTSFSNSSTLLFASVALPLTRVRVASGQLTVRRHKDEKWLTQDGDEERERAMAKGRMKGCNGALCLPITHLIAVVCQRKCMLSHHTDDFRLLLWTRWVMDAIYYSPAGFTSVRRMVWKETKKHLNVTF